MAQIKKNVAYVIDVQLTDATSRPSFKNSPTIAAGDFMVSVDEAAFANLATLPTVTPAAGANVKISLSAAEMNGDRIVVKCIDQTNPKEWDDVFINVLPVDATVADTFARVGAPAGASVSADVAAVKTDAAAIKVKSDFLPSVTAGGVGGVFIAGTNAATTITTSLTTTFTGNLTGSVGSVTGLTAATVHADLDDIQARLPAALVAGRMDASVGAMAAGTVTAAAIATDAIDNDAIAADVTAVIADAVWNAATISYGTAGTYGLLVETNLDGTVSSRSTQASVDTVATYVDTEVAAIKAKTDILPAAFPANFADLAIAVTTGRVTVGTNADKTGYALTVTPPTANENADALLDRNVAGGSSAGRRVKEALYVLRNKSAIGAGTLTVYGVDDVTAAFTAAVTTTAGDPISAIDPA